MTRLPDQKKWDGIINHLKKVRKDTMYGIGKAIGTRPYTAKAILDKLIAQGKIFCQVIVEDNRFKYYYSTEPIEKIANDMITTSPLQSSLVQFKIPSYYKKLDDLFGAILASKDRKFLIQYLSEIGIDVSEIMSLQQEANDFEMGVEEKHE